MRLTDAQVEQIIHWAEKGKTGLWIARKLDIHPATVNYRMLRNGYDPFASEQKYNSNPGAFSPREDKRLLELGRGGMSVEKIAKSMKRPRTSVRMRLLLLEIRAEKALERAA